MGRVLHDFEAVPIPEDLQSVPVHRFPGHMDRKDHFDLPGFENLFKAVQVEIGAVGQAVDEYRVGPQVPDHLGGGREGVVWDGAEVPGADPEGFEGQVEPGGGAVHRQGMGHPTEGGEFGLKGGADLSGGQPARAHDLEDRLLFPFAEDRPGKGDEVRMLFSHWFPQDSVLSTQARLYLRASGTKPGGRSGGAAYYGIGRAGPGHNSRSAKAS